MAGKGALLPPGMLNGFVPAQIVGSTVVHWKGMGGGNAMANSFSCCLFIDVNVGDWCGVQLCEEMILLLWTVELECVCVLSCSTSALWGYGA